MTLSSRRVSHSGKTVDFGTFAYNKGRPFLFNNKDDDAKNHSLVPTLAIILVRVMIYQPYGI